MKVSPRSISETEKSRLCVLFPGALGDFICFLPALQMLAENAPVDLFARSEFAGLAPDRVAVHSLHRPEISKLFTANGAADEPARSFFGAYAAVYSWMGSGQPEFVRQLQAVSKGRVHIFPFRSADSKRHQAEYYLSCQSDTASLDRYPCISLRAEAIAWCDDFWARHALQRRAVLVIGPGSGAREKNWPEDHFIAVADWWRDEVNGIVVVLVGPVEEERGGATRFGNSGLLIRGLDLAQAAALLHRSDLYVGNDSGLTHLAAATGIRTVALFGPSDRRQWAPRGGKATVLSRNEACSPCAVATMKNCPHRRCLAGLHSADVIAALARLPEVASLTRGGVGIKV